MYRTDQNPRNATEWGDYAMARQPPSRTGSGVELINRANIIDAKALAGGRNYVMMRTSVITQAESVGVAAPTTTAAVIGTLPFLGGAPSQGTTRSAMQSSLSRANPMRELLTGVNSESERVRAHFVGAAKA